MSGLFLLLVAAVWIFIAVKLALCIDKKFPKNIRGIPFLISMVALVPLPIIDEVIFGKQFENLCDENSSVAVDVKETNGRTVRFAGAEPELLHFGTIRAHKKKLNFTDTKTQELVYHYYRINASGGILMRFLGIANSAPLTFEKFCQPNDVENINVKLGTFEVSN